MRKDDVVDVFRISAKTVKIAETLILTYAVYCIYSHVKVLPSVPILRSCLIHLH